MPRVLSVDPGVTTGYCYGNVEGGKLTYYPFQIVDDVDDLWARLQKFDPKYIVIEDFEFRGGARKGLNIFPVQLIGVARLYSLHPKTDCALFVQKAATGKGYYTDAILKQRGLYKRGLPHGMDASRHLLQWFTFGFGHKFQGQDQDFATLVPHEFFIKGDSDVAAASQR
jgi:hypothetical protein